MKKLIILDHFLTANKGHDEQYDFSLAQEALRRGIEVEVWAPLRDNPDQPKFVKQYLDDPFWKRSGALRQALAAFLSIFEWRRLLTRPELDKDTVVLIQTVKLPILVLLSVALFRLKLKPKIAIVLRRMMDLRLLKYLAKKGVLFLPDSELITKELNDRGMDKVKTLPIPHLPLRRSVTRGERPVIGYFGEARIDKGFDLLPELIELFFEEDRDALFIIQINVHNAVTAVLRAAETIYELKLAHPERILILDHYLSDAEYAENMGRCSAIVIPYRKEFYGGGTSGILAEAIACGCRAIVPSGTWMAEQKQKYDKISVFEEFSSNGVCQALEASLKEDKRADEDKLRRQVDEWYNFHSPENYLNILAEAAQ